MSPEGFEPLPVELWLHELGRLAEWCAEPPGDAPEDWDERAIRRAFHLAALAPAGIRRLSMPAIPLNELEFLLESGAVDEAGRAVIGTHGYVDLVQVPQSDIWIASFAIAGEDPVRCEASSAIRARICAWATFFTKAAG